MNLKTKKMKTNNNIKCSLLSILIITIIGLFTAMFSVIYNFDINNFVIFTFIFGIGYLTIDIIEILFVRYKIGNKNN